MGLNHCWTASVRSRIRVWWCSCASARSSRSSGPSKCIKNLSTLASSRKPLVWKPNGEISSTMPRRKIQSLRWASSSLPKKRRWKSKNSRKHWHSCTFSIRKVDPVPARPPLTTGCNYWNTTNKRLLSWIRRRKSLYSLRSYLTWTSQTSPSWFPSRRKVKCSNPCTISTGKWRILSKISQERFGRSWIVTSLKRLGCDSLRPSKRSSHRSMWRTQYTTNCSNASNNFVSQPHWLSNSRVGPLPIGTGRSSSKKRARRSKYPPKPWLLSKSSHCSFTISRRRLVKSATRPTKNTRTRSNWTKLIRSGRRRISTLPNTRKAMMIEVGYSPVPMRKNYCWRTNWQICRPSRVASMWLHSQTVFEAGRRVWTWLQSALMCGCWSKRNGCTWKVSS